jgi:hypothetical protein
MNKDITRVVLVTAGAVLFNIVFWQEKFGLNMLLFDAFLLGAIFFLYPQARHYSTVRWLSLGHLTCLAMVLVHNTALSVIANTITLLLLAGFAEYAHRSVWYAGGSMFMNFIMVPASFVQPIQLKGVKGVKPRSISRLIRFALFPVIIALVFFAIYLSGNTVFSKLVEAASQYLEKYFINFINVFSLQRLLFTLFGLLLTAVILLKSNMDYFSRRDAAQTDNLQRNRVTQRKHRAGAFFGFIEMLMGRMATGMMALKNENTTGILSLALLNTLLLVINIIDINYLWFNFTYNDNQPVYKMVHEGTEMLILSIVLAMAILLFFFKGNLNFYRRNKWLKYGAYAWIIQNTMLVSSVLLRDYYYILKHGLAYKRIGVLFFLLMVLIGLITVFIKIWARKTNYFLFRVNAWAGVIVLVLTTTIHWDEMIASYNLQRKDQVPLDAEFLLSLSDKTLPLLHNNTAALPQHDIKLLQRREAYFLQKQESYSWLSWNYADAELKNFYLK